MYPDKTYTRKISICILNYSTLYTRPNLHCSIYSVTPLNHKDGLYLRMGGEHCLHQRCMDFVATRLFTRQVFRLQCLLGQRQYLDGFYKKGSVHPSFSPDIFLELDRQFFLNFGMVLGTQMKGSMTTRFFRKTFFASNTGKMDQNWTQNIFFLNLLKNQSLTFTEFVL